MLWLIASGLPCKTSENRFKTSTGSIFKVVDVGVTPLYAFIVSRQNVITFSIVNLLPRLQCIKAWA
jgi:hypothetical protein